MTETKAFEAAWKAWQSTKSFVDGMTKRFIPPKMFDGRVAVPWQRAYLEAASDKTKQELDELGDLSVRYAVASRNVIQNRPYEQIEVKTEIIDGKESRTESDIKVDKDYLANLRNEIETRLMKLTGVAPAPPAPPAPILTVTAGQTVIDFPPLK